MAAAYPKQVVTTVPTRVESRRVNKKTKKAPKPPKTKKPKKPKTALDGVIDGRPRKPVLPPSPAPVPTPPPTSPTNNEFETLADLYREIFGPQLGFTPQTSQSGESVLVVPGEEESGGSNKGMIILILIVVAGGGYYLYKRSKKAA